MKYELMKALKAEKSRKRKESRTSNSIGIILVWNTGSVQVSYINVKGGNRLLIKTELPQLPLF